MDPQELMTWLPPGKMTGRIHAFDARIGGGYQMSLFYPDSEPSLRGKTSEREDRVNVRFTALSPPSKIVEIVTFDSVHPSFQGEMEMSATFEAVSDGTRVTLAFENIPRGIRPEDNETGSRLSLEQLAHYLEVAP